jgi:hypothetical protein
VEQFILAKGHTAERRIDDYGYDLDMETYDENGAIEGGLIRIQLKATDKLAARIRGDCVCVDIDVKHYELWIDEPMPVYLILYDALERRAYWTHVQNYFAADPSRRPRRGAKTLRMSIPMANEFTEDTVDEMRARKAETWARDRPMRRGHG